MTDPQYSEVIDVAVFNVQVGVFNTDEDRVKTLRQLGVDAVPGPAASVATAHVDKGPDEFCWFSMVIATGTSMSTWAHESVHIADWIMANHGIPTGHKNTEVRAYIVAHLFEGLERIMAERAERG